MSVLTERRILDFAEDGVACARAGVLVEGLDELIGAKAPSPSGAVSARSSD